MSEQQGLVLSNEKRQVSKNINDAIEYAMSSTDNVMEKVFIQAEAMGIVKANLTDDFMKPVMELQGTKIGFLTDLDREGGYTLPTVRNVLMEAMMLGLKPVGNEFNIIAGKMYPTKQGFSSLLRRLQKSDRRLSFEITPEMPIEKDEKVTVTTNIKWTIDGKQNERTKIFPVNKNKGMSADGVLGKAERKAKAWLFNFITDQEIGDGDVTDTEHVVVSSTTNKTPVQNTTMESKSEQMTKDEVHNIGGKVTDEVEQAKLDNYLKKSTTKADLETRYNNVKDRIPAAANVNLVVYNELKESLPE